MEKNKKAYTVFAWAALCLLAFTFIFPLYWIVTGSFKLQTATVQLPPQWFPAEPTAANYVKLFKNPAGLWLWNSVFQAAMATLLTCFTASLAGYALAKKRFTGAKFIFAIFVCAMALPKQVVMVPLVRIMAAIGLYNTSWAVIFPTVGWPFGVFLMKQFSETLPSELLEAARIDGAGELRTFWDIVLPIVKPGACHLHLRQYLERLFYAAHHAQKQRCHHGLTGHCPAAIGVRDELRADDGGRHIGRGTHRCSIHLLPEVFYAGHHHGRRQGMTAACIYPAAASCLPCAAPLREERFV